MSARHSYGGPSDSHVLMNPMPPSTASSRNVNGTAGGGKAVAGKNKVNGGGGSGGGIGGRHSLGSTISSVAPTPTPQQQQQQHQHQQQQQQHYSPIPPNNNYHQRPTQHDMVVENIPNSTMTNPNTAATSPTNNNHNSSHYSQQQQQPQQQQHHTSRKTKPKTSDIREIITIESDPDDNSKNNSSLPPPQGPSLAGSASRNRSLLNNGHYDPVRPNRASASPSISFLTDPQPTPSHPPPAATFRKPVENSPAPPAIKPEIDSPPFAVSIKAATPDVIAVAPLPPPPQPQPQPTVIEPPAKVSKPEKPEKPAKESTKEAPGQRSPKAAKAKKSSTAVSATSVPKPSGNGLLSGLPGVDILGESGDQIEIPTIYIHVPLNGETNKYVNFAKLAEQQYGPFALNPRAHRERMRAADTSGDEMMVDGSESESAIEDRAMSGMDGDSTADTKPKKRKRKLQDSYDALDPFIDDSEMLYEEQAAATKDGFFVYSGPLIPQGEKIHVERADGTTRRGRGGRARGGARGGTAAAKPATQRKRKNNKKSEKEAAEKERLAAAGQ